MKENRKWLSGVCCFLGILISLASCKPVDKVQPFEETQVQTLQLQPGRTDLESTVETQSIPTHIPEGETRPITLGFYTGESESYEAIQAFSSHIRIVSADIFFVQADGSIGGRDDFDLVSFDREHGIQTLACISNYNSETLNYFDPERAYMAIVEKKDEFIPALVALAQDNGYDGVNIDFENIAYSDDIEEVRTAFNVFITELADQLHAEGLMLVVSVPGKTGDSIEDTWAFPFDLARLGKTVDYVQLMTYDQHGPWGEDGPVAGADWVEQCVKYALTVMDPSRLLIGLPAYGYDWDLTDSDPDNGIYSASSFRWTDIGNLLSIPGAEARWDQAAASPFLTYQQDGHDHIAWYEDVQSIQIKSALVKKYRLAGMSMWALGYENESYWLAVEEGME